MFCFGFGFYTIKKEDIAVCVFKYVRACVLDSRGEERERETDRERERRGRERKKR